MAEPIVNVLGPVAIKHMGEYNSATNYEKLNVVTYQGSSYCAKGATIGNLPTNTTYWDLMASKGATGETGPAPVKGVDYYTAADIASLEATLSSDVHDEVSTQIGNLTSATPLVAASVAGMTNTSRIYVNTSDGKWYYYDGDSWEIGGTYEATSSDIEINELDARIGENDETTTTLDLSGYRTDGCINTDSTSVGNEIVLGNQNYFSLFTIPSKYLDKFEIKFRIKDTNSTKTYYAFTDSDNIVLSMGQYSGTDGESKTVTVTAPVNTSKFYFWSYANSNNYKTHSACKKYELISIMDEINTIKEEYQSNPIPSYYKENDWLDNKIASIKEKSVIAKGVTFGFITDFHFNANSLNSKYLLREVFDKTSVNFAIAGGDYPANYGNVDDLKNSGKLLLDYVRYNDDKVLPMHGNHDFSATSSDGQVSISNKYAYDYIIRPVEGQINSQPGKMYWYKDIEAQKVRIICIDGWENYPPVSNPNNTVQAWITQQQYDWFINLLNTSDGYSVVVISHSALNSGMDGYTGTHAPIHELIKAFKNRTTYSFSRTGTLLDGETYSISINADFSNRTGDFVCVISGHSHIDESLTVDGILNISTTCDAHYSNDGHGAAVNTVTEQAFDIFCIDTEAKTINAVRIGRGSNRNWSY